MAKSNGKDRDLKVVWRKTASLAPYAKNARTHSDAQVAQIAASITEYGFTNPVLIDEKGGIIAGHGRVQAANVLKRATVPCIVLSGLTAAQRRAYVIADNKLALNAGWNEELLRAELGALKLAGFDLALTGFTDAELRPIFAEQGNTDPDEAPPVPTAPVSRTGDLWLLGEHRLLCGDSTKAEDVEALLAGAKPHLMVTDPPYGVEYDAAAARSPSKNSARGRVVNDDRADWREAWALFPGDVAYVWHAGLRAKDVVESLHAASFVLRAQLIWDKQRPVLSRGHYHFQHEPCWYAVRDGATASWSGDRQQSTVWGIPKPQKSETGHSTQKPVECMRRPIENNSKPGDAVYEPFSGSGTTIIAAEMTGRSCYAIEIAENYCDVAVERWQMFTGRKATLDGDGRSFDAVKSSRLGGREQLSKSGKGQSRAPGSARRKPCKPSSVAA